ncbi:response regulator transcription factor [Thermobifida halotolerans]|uniref:Response regulator transcription factor n=1 Tax=Thermobifida halotolerans TaxID=483545 RepID=A0A399G1L1_9ACTN|nr:response regulator transcription factor [Thermobifida halotolerans]UOE18002.1 response regulator transcription factor [Thermobifida halotolerans]
MSPITVLVVDDNIVVRAGLLALLETSDDIRIAGEAGNGVQAVERARQLRPDIVLLDVRMPVRDGVSVVEELAELAKVVMLTHTEDPEVVRTALRRGASGYLVHGHFTLEELGHALREVARGTGSPLSPVAATALVTSLRSASTAPGPADPAALGLTGREAEVLGAAARGLSNAETARELFLSEKTVKNHINRIFRKLGVGTRAAAIARWNGHALPDPKPSSGPT